MKENLYTFNINAWHCRLYNFLWNIEPHETFKTMCPYFWSSVLTYLILWPLLLIRRFIWFIQDISENITWISKLINEMADRKADRISTKHKKEIDDYDNLIDGYAKLFIADSEEAWRKYMHVNDLIEVAWMESDTRRECYEFMCWLKSNGYPIHPHTFGDMIHKVISLPDYEIQDRSLEQHKKYDHSFIIYNSFNDITDHASRYEVIKKKEAVRPPSKFALYTFLGFSALVLCIISSWIGYHILLGLYNMTSLLIDFIIGNKEGMIAASITLSITGILYFLIIFIKNFWGESIGNALIWLCTPVYKLFKFLLITGIIMGFVKFFKIIFGMIHATYKNYCPIITWETSEENKS